MRRLLVTLPVGALLLLGGIGGSTPVSAHIAGPCAENPGPGHSEFAEHHIVPMAQAGMLGAGGHKPGAHRGFSACNPSENRP